MLTATPRYARSLNASYASRSPRRYDPSTKRWAHVSASGSPWKRNTRDCSSTSPHSPARHCVPDIAGGREPCPGTLPPRSTATIEDTHAKKSHALPGGEYLHAGQRANIQGGHQKNLQQHLLQEGVAERERLQPARIPVEWLVRLLTLTFASGGRRSPGTTSAPRPNPPSPLLASPPIC